MRGKVIRSIAHTNKTSVFVCMCLCLCIVYPSKKYKNSKHISHGCGIEKKKEKRIDKNKKQKL